MSFFLASATKFRELNVDKVLYNIDGHTPVMPITCTVNSELPIPRKGNPGALKTFVNHHFVRTLDQGLDSERNVPIVGKIELSVPVGVASIDVDAVLTNLIAILEAAKVADSQERKLVLTGVLPQGK